VTVLLSALHNEYVANGNIDEAVHQRCVLRCFGQCLYPTPASDPHQCVHVCRDMCLAEDAGSAGRSANAAVWLTMTPLAVCVLLVCATALALRLVPMRASMRSLVDRMSGKRSR